MRMMTYPYDGVAKILYFTMYSGIGNKVVAL